MGNKALPTISSTQENKYLTSNDADNALDLAFSDLLPCDLSAGDLAVTPAQFMRAVCFQASGNTVSRTLSFSALRGMFIVQNKGSAALTVALGTTTFSLAAAGIAFCYADGTANGLEALVFGGAAGVTSVGGLTGAITLTALLDAIGSAAEGDILYRGASVWTRLAAGATATLFLKTGGTGAIPSWAAPFANPRVQAVTYASTVTLDFSAHDVFEITLTGNITIDFTGGTDGQRAQVRLTQDGTGSRTVTWGTSVAFGSDVTSAGITASTGASKVDYFAVAYSGAATKYHMIAAARGY